MNNTLVSISCITYNHGPFIKDCIEGFLMQKTSFNFEILIHDDASTDDTVDIIKLYRKKYPDLIKPIFQKENQYSKGQRGMNMKFNFPRAQGKYIALCEGDDYWTDPLKLQKQVDFLEKNCSYVACFTNAKDIDEIWGKEIKYYEFEENKVYNSKDVIENGGGLFPTASLVFRNEIKVWPDWMFNHKSGDRALGLMLADIGEFYLLNETTSVYRRHDGGIHSSIRENISKRTEVMKDNIILLNEFNLYTFKKYDKVIKTTISKIVLKIFSINNESLKGYLTSSYFKNLLFKHKLLYFKTRIYARIFVK